MSGFKVKGSKRTMVVGPRDWVRDLVDKNKGATNEHGNTVEFIAWDEMVEFDQMEAEAYSRWGGKGQTLNKLVDNGRVKSISTALDSERQAKALRLCQRWTPEQRDALLADFKATGRWTAAQRDQLLKDARRDSSD